MKRIILASIVLLVSLAGAAGNSKKRTSKAAEPLTAAGTFVVPPKPAYDNAGKEIGYVNSKGRLVVNGRERASVSVERNGMLLDRKGNRIGFVSLENDEVVGDPGKRRVLTSGPNGGCVIPERNPLNQRMLDPGESIPVCGKTVEEVMGSIQVMFGTACKAGVEQILYVVRFPDGRHELRRGDNNDGTSTDVWFRPRLANGEIIIGIIHDHPIGKTKGRDALWPSELDAVTAMKYDTNIYVHDCQSDEMSVAYLHKPRGKKSKNKDFWKKVMLVKGGAPSEELKMPLPGNRCDGRDPYDETQYEQYAAESLSQSCDNRLVTKTQTLGAVRTGESGGYCQCAQPYLYGEHVRISRKRDKVQHWGVVGFVCSKCCKIEKAMYAKAQELKAKQSGEGVPTFWMDIQLQLAEDMRAKINSIPESERQKMAEAMVRSLQSVASPKP